MSPDVYHVTFVCPESAEVAKRLERPDDLMSEEEMARQLQAYHREVQSLQDTYCHCLKIIDADQPHVDMFNQGENTYLQLLSLVFPLYMCSWYLFIHFFMNETGEFISIATFCS